MSPALHEFIANYGLWAVLGGTLLEARAWWCSPDSWRTSTCCACRA